MPSGKTGFEDSLFVLSLERNLSARIQAPVVLTVTNNKSSMLNIKHQKGTYYIRLHHMFLDADETVVSDIALFARTGKSKLIQKYINLHEDWIGKKRTRKIRVRHKGEYFNLKELFDILNRDYFDGAVTSLITWGKKQSKRNRSSINFGSYSDDEDLIRINAKLDSERVPRYFILYIIYHEMLHNIVASSKGRHHTGEFRKKEKGYGDYRRAADWQKMNIGMFIK